MIFLYEWPVWVSIPMVVLVAVALAVGGLALARRFVLPHIIEYRDDINDAISGALGAIGVFYGITLGLIAVEVWHRHAIAEDIAAREAAAIHTLYLNTELIKESKAPDTAGPTPATDRAESPTPAMKKVSDYLRTVICDTWVKQRKGEKPAPHVSHEECAPPV